LAVEKELNAADKAWETRRTEWIRTKEFLEFAKDFDFWQNSQEGKAELKGHQKKVDFVSKSLSKENLEKMSEEEFREVWKKLYATGIINEKGRDKFFQNNIINANGGFENVRSKLIDLLYGNDPLAERFEKGINEIKQFGDSTVSEILNNVYPDKCCMWNDKVKKAILILGIKKLVPKQFLENKSIRKADDYEKCIQLLSLIKDELSQYNVNDFYELDHFFWYVATRLFWRIQPGGDGGKWWDELRDNNIIAVNFDITEDLSKAEDISKVVKKYRPEKNVPTTTRQLEDLVDEIAIGDFVIANNGQSEIFGIGKITGSTRGAVGIMKLRKLLVLVPSIVQQKEIVAKIKNAEKKFKSQEIQLEIIKKNYQINKKNIIHIKSSILASAFSGKLVN